MTASLSNGCFLFALFVLPLANIDKVAFDRGGGRHHGRNEVRSAAAALPAFEIPVAGRGTSLAGTQNVRIHPQAHAATCIAPFKTGVDKNPIQSFLFRLSFDAAAARYHHGLDRISHLVSAYHIGRVSKILNPTVRARADKYAIHRNALDWRAGPEIHVLERKFGRLPLAGIGKICRIGHHRVDRGNLAGVGSPGHLRRDIIGMKNIDSIVFGSCVGRKTPPTRYRRFEVLGSKFSTSQIFKSRFVGRNHASPCSRFDGHIANGHSLFHRQVANRLPGIFDDVSCPARRRDLADQVHDQIFSSHAARELAVNSQLIRFWSGLTKRLCCKYMFNLTRSDAERQRSKRAVSRRMRIAAYDRHSRLGQTQLGTDDMHDPLFRTVEVVQADTEFGTVLPERFDLLPGNGIGNGQAAIGGWNIVILRGDRQLGLTDPATRQAQAFKRLWTGHFVNQVQVDIENRMLPGLMIDYVLVPDFLEKSSRYVCNHVTDR